jgi:integrase
MRDRQAAEHGFGQVRDGWLAVDAAGQPLRPEAWSGRWTVLCRDAGVPPVTLHAARHSSVTAMRAAGVPDHIVAKWHGHDEVVMRRTYSHANQDSLAAAGRALSDALAATSVTSV